MCVFYSTYCWSENTFIIKYIKLIEMRIPHFEVLKLKMFMNIHYKYLILIVLIILHIYIFNVYKSAGGSLVPLRLFLPGFILGNHSRGVVHKKMSPIECEC